MKKGGKKVVIGALTLIFIGLGGVAYLVGPEAASAWRAGFFQREARHEYVGTSLDNLKRLHTAMLLYHDSEGQFPNAAGWMDAIENRLQTNDLKPGEGEKKLRNPALPENPEVYGYAMNSLASGKFKDDLPDPAKTILLFDSQNTARNASGDPLKDAPNPARPGGNLAITIDGALLKDGKPIPPGS